MFIDPSTTSRLTPFEGAEGNCTLTTPGSSAPSNGARGKVALRSINISPLSGVKPVLLNLARSMGLPTLARKEEVRLLLH